MSTTVTFAGHLADDPELGYTREDKMVNHRYQNAQREWLEEERTPHDVRVYGEVATHVADSCGAGNGITVRGRLKTVAWADRETGEKRIKRVVEVNDYVGLIGAWVNRCAAARIESTRRSAPQAV